MFPCKNLICIELGSCAKLNGLLKSNFNFIIIIIAEMAGFFTWLATSNDRDTHIWSVIYSFSIQNLRQMACSVEKTLSVTWLDEKLPLLQYYPHTPDTSSKYQPQLVIRVCSCAGWPLLNMADIILLCLGNPYVWLFVCQFN